MSRIRSIHPGLWTDEDFVTLSAFARLLFMGLWNECDDKGLFEWKPLTIKMRLMPADNVDAAALLDEIAAAGCIRKYEVGGKAYGAVRNFCKFQRPKKPNDIYPATAEILEFCACNYEPEAVEAQSVPNQFPTGGEIAPQMEDGGGNRRVKGDIPLDKSNGAAPSSDKAFWDAASAYLSPYVKGSPRALIGKWSRDYGREPTSKAITAAQLERAVEPIAYITKVLRKGAMAEAAAFSGPC